MTKSWFVLGGGSEVNNKKQQIIQIGKELDFKVLKGINDHIHIDLTYRRFSFSEETTICACMFNIKKILDKT